MKSKIVFITPFLASIGGVEKTASELKYSSNKNGIPFYLYTLFFSVNKNAKYLAPLSKLFTFFRFVFGGTIAIFIWSYINMLKNNEFLADINEGIIIIRHSSMAYALLLIKKRLSLNFSLVYLPAHYSKDFYLPIIKKNVAEKNFLNTLKALISLYSERFFEAKLLGGGVGIVTFSYNLKARLEKNYKLAESSAINVIRPGVSKEIKSQIKVDTAITEEVKYLYVGRIDEGKNVDLLLDLFQRSNILNLKLKIVGEGALLSALKEQYSQNKNISFLGGLSGKELSFEYANADYLILPTFNESYGHVISESLCVGTPVIGFYFDECKNAIGELIENNINGLHITGKSQEDFNSVIHYSIKKRTFFKKSTKKISKNAKSIFCWDMFLNELIRLYTKGDFT